MNAQLCLAAAFFVLAGLVDSAESQPLPTGAVPHISDVLGAITQGNGARARDLLRAIPDSDGVRDAQLRSCIQERLEGTARGESKLPDPFTREVLEAYEAYWRSGVVGPSARGPAEAKLQERLRHLLGDDGLADVAAAEPAMAARLERAGYHSLQGMTGVLHELMIWSRQTEKEEHVELPEGPQLTRVFLLDGFLSLGWTSFLTCGRSGTGGWTKPEGVYAVVPAYRSLDDENFKVNFIAHESQHFADQARFPALKDWEKEYRAKLAELALADTTRAQILERFRASQGDDPADAHSYANRRVLKSLRTRLRLGSNADLSAVAPARLRQAAASELRTDSARRKRDNNLRRPEGSDKLRRRSLTATFSHP